jgi:lecithin:cholesterol acyltransferase
MTKPVFLIPGFTASDLAILSTSQRIWWDLHISPLLGLGSLRLAPNGVDPGPPDGVPCGHSMEAQNPWPDVVAQLIAQMGSRGWGFQVLSWDWRQNILTAANALAENIRTSVTAQNPCTLVGHSAGGLLATLAWSSLVGTADTDKVRRIITIGTPFQGSYGPIQWLAGVNDTVQQLLSIGAAYASVVGFDPAQWTLAFLNDLALTWPSFYELFPYLGVPDAAQDPNRPLFYATSSYPPIAQPSQALLNYSRDIFQPLVRASSAFPPSWVLTTVAGTGVATPYRKLSANVPIKLTDLENTFDGDGVVTIESAMRTPAAQATVSGQHTQLPLGVTADGALAAWIEDPRGPLDPPPMPAFNKRAITVNITAPPEADYLSGLTCLSGG